MRTGIRLTVLIGMLLLGVMLGSTTLFSPLHEWFHRQSSLSQGIPARITNWVTTEVNRVTLPTLLAGFQNVQWMWIILAPLMAMIGFRFPFLTGGFPLGMQIGNYFFAKGSYDFTEGLRAVVNNTEIPSGLTKEYVFSRFTEYLNSWWDKFCIPAFLITAGLVVLILFKRKEIPRGKKEKGKGL